MSDNEKAPDGEISAFSPAFLDLLEGLDDVGTAEEAELAGPWKIVATDGRFALTRAYDDPRADLRPEGVFTDLPTALRFFAVVPAVGRPAVIEVDSSRGSAGWHAVRSEGSTVGQLRVFHDRFAHAAHVADMVTRSPLSLAALLVASGPQAIREVGRILQNLSRAGDAGRSWLDLAEFPPR
jgi:hypothetical protein